jgi:hypothetical protein
MNDGYVPIILVVAAVLALLVFAVHALITARQLDRNWHLAKERAAQPESPDRLAPTVLDGQLDWYDRRATWSRFWFWWLKVPEMVVAATIPFLAGFGQALLGSGGTYLIGGLGVVVIVLEGIQQLGQFQRNWITYRSTGEALRWEKYLYLAKAGPYATAERPDALVVERIVSLVSREHGEWRTTREDAMKTGGTPSKREPRTRPRHLSPVRNGSDSKTPVGSVTPTAPSVRSE